MKENAKQMSRKKGGLALKNFIDLWVNLAVSTYRNM